MKIETRFKVGDIVFTINKETMKVESFPVHSINVHVDENDTSVYIYKKCDYHDECYYENKCFSSEEELLHYITSREAA